MTATPQAWSAISWSPTVLAHGISWRKRSLVREFTGVSKIRFIRHVRTPPTGAVDLLLWGSMPVPAPLAGRARVVRMEDGFLRSVGLGADLTRPLSWVLDTRGIYYDPRTPSDLEVLLQGFAFTPALEQRAAALRHQIVQAGISKYNQGGAPWAPPHNGRTVVLVMGQVETDASIATGTLDIRTNMDLLQAVRAARPDAWVVYKPHPDVEAGLRRQGRDEDQATRWADEVLRQGAPAQILPLVDEVHVMTSLAGFEALLRGKAVFCYGQPFYAGWGLTQDRHAHARRTRRLSLDALVAGALLLYPVYVSRQTRRRCSAEEALQELVALRGGDAHAPAPLPWWRRWLRPLLARP